MSGSGSETGARVRGGWYDLAHVVPRTWTHLLAEAAGQPIDPATQTPAAWREYVARRTGPTAPGHMTDGAPAVLESFESGYTQPTRPISDHGHPRRGLSFARADAAIGAMPHHGTTRRGYWETSNDYN